MSGIPAAALFPPAFGDNKPEWAFAARDVPEGEMRRFFLASEITPGYKYYTLNREIVLSREWPEDYETKIGYKYGHGPGKVDEKGEPKEERGKPAGTWLMRAWLVEEERMVALIIDSYPLQQQMQQAVAANDEFEMLNEGITNFYYTIFHNKNPSQKSLTYTAQASQRVLRNERAYAEAQKLWYPDNYFKGLNPFEPPAQPPGPPRLPAMARDENGADAPMEIRQQDSVNW